jgi:glycine hydroxymethyltransferase
MVANLVADVLDNPNDDAAIARVAEQATALCHRFPVYAK